MHRGVRPGCRTASGCWWCRRVQALPSLFCVRSEPPVVTKLMLPVSRSASVGPARARVSHAEQREQQQCKKTSAASEAADAATERHSHGLNSGSRAAAQAGPALIMRAPVSPGLRTTSHPPVGRKRLRFRPSTSGATSSTGPVGAPVGEPPSGSRLTAICFEPASAARCAAREHAMVVAGVRHQAERHRAPPPSGSAQSSCDLPGGRSCTTWTCRLISWLSPRTSTRQ